jgi:hypothetical protein
MIEQVMWRAQWKANGVDLCNMFADNPGLALEFSLSIGQ